MFRGTWSSILLVAVFSFASSAAQEIKFADVTREAELFVPLDGLLGHGAAWGDFDNDGHADLYVGGFCDRPDKEYAPALGPIPTRLFRNLGTGKFEQVKQPAVEFHGRTSGAVFADLDNNGTLELYVANNAKEKSKQEFKGPPPPQVTAKALGNKLFRNDQGAFVDISAASGACPDGFKTARNIGLFDFDADGLLDLFIVGDRFTRSPQSVLLRNAGNLKFVAASAPANIPAGLFGLGLAVADVNEDGRPDFFVGHSNRFFLSDGKGKYVESAELNKTLAWTPLNSEDWPCGAAFGDLNQDGRLDLVLSIHGERARNRVYLNRGLHDGVPRFQDVSREAGLPDQLSTKSPHVEIQDFDNDGWPDLYFSTAWLDEDDNVTPLVYRNLGLRDGLPRFAAPPEPRGKQVYFPAGPTADYDNDGRLDMFLVNWFAGNHSRLLHNESPQRNWLDVRVVGTKKLNRMGIGAVVSVFEPGRVKNPLVHQEVATGYGYASGQPAICHFGLGELTTVDLVVRIPGGVITKRGVKANQRFVVEEQ